MSVSQQQDTPNKRCCISISSALKNAFSHCHTAGRLSTSSPEDDNLTADFADELEVVVSAIRTRAMEAKLRRKANMTTDGFWWVFSPTTGELFIAPKAEKQREEYGNAENDEREEFMSVGSGFSLCPSAAVNVEEFLSVKTNFSPCSSLKGAEFQDFRSRSIIQELCYCEGWPFGLGRKALLLPPLPKSPSESWSWHKGPKIIRLI